MTDKCVSHSYTEALKPCPHCGEDGDALEAYRLNDDWAVRCKSCEGGATTIGVWNMRHPGPNYRDLPSGWVAVPVKATIPMHNAAAFGELYESPRIVYDEHNGILRLKHGCPDWSRVWSVMIAKAPQAPPIATSRGKCEHNWFCRLDGKHGSREVWKCLKCGEEKER